MCVPDRPTATKGPGVFAHLELIEKLLRVVVDDSLYEINEQRPSTQVIVATADMLGNSVPSEYLGGIEIDPGSGAIDITWRDRQRGRRVKASFGPNPNAFALYHEQKDHGRVTTHALIPNARNAELNYWVRWCHGAV
jgi:hypothetical protein